MCNIFIKCNVIHSLFSSNLMPIISNDNCNSWYSLKSSQLYNVNLHLWKMTKTFHCSSQSSTNCGLSVASVFSHLEPDGGWGFWECIAAVDAEVSLVRSSNAAILKSIASSFIGRVSVGPLGLPVTETKSARLGDNTAAWLSTYHIHQLVVIQKSSC